MPLFLFIFHIFITYIHTITFIHYIYPSPFAEASLHFFIASMLSGRHLPVVPSRESNSGLPYSKPTRYQLSHAAPCWATPHLTEPRRTLLSHAAPFWATPHLTEPRRTLLSHAAPFWATPHLSEPRRTFLSHAAPYWATPHLSEPRRTLLSHAAPCWILLTCSLYVQYYMRTLFERFEKIHIWLQHLYVDVRERKETHLNILRWFLFFSLIKLR